MQALKLEAPYSAVGMFTLPPALKKLVEKGREEVTYLLQVEDSTENGEMPVHGYNASHRCRAREVFKAVFWTGAAIAIPLLIGS